MAVSGIPEPCATHAKNIAKLALDMMDRSQTVTFEGEVVVSRYTYDFALNYIGIKGKRYFF